MRGNEIYDISDPGFQIMLKRFLKRSVFGTRGEESSMSEEPLWKLILLGLQSRFFVVITFIFQLNSYLVGGLTLSDFLEAPWSRGSSLLPPGTCLHFCRAQGSAFPTLLVESHRTLLTQALALSADQFLSEKNPLRVCTR